MAFSPLCEKIIPAYNGNYSNGRLRPLKAITIHHTAGILDIESLGAIWQRAGRNGSSHYGVGYTGRIAGYVDEANTAWTNSNWDSNNESITIEVSNDSTGGDWHVSDASIESTAKLVADIAKRNNIGTLVKGQNVTWHSMFTATSCPGSYLMSKCDYIIAKANEINGTAPTPSPTPSAGNQILEVGSVVRFNGVFPINEVLGLSSKYPNGAVGSYATCYGAPCGSNDYIPCGPIATCNADGTNINYNGVCRVGGHWTCNKEFVVKKVEFETKYTPNGVATLEADGVQFRVDCGPLYEVRDR